jgi:hypothetical protein
MRKYIFNKKSSLIILIILLFSALSYFFFFFKSTEAQVCLPLTGYLVWPGTWESGWVPMASTTQYFLTRSPIYVSGSNVGIGTTLPSQKLDVYGGYIRSDTGFCIGTSCITSWSVGGITGSGSSGQVTFWTGATSLGGDNNFFWNNTNKRLGIGTTTPQTSLHVAGNITADTFLGTINAANVSSGQFGANTGGGNYYFPSNVGIGTTTPAYKLDIAGALRLQPSSQPTGANGVIYYDSTANKFKCYEDGAWTDCIGGGGFWAANGNDIYNTNTGNVGIGTTTPSSRLTVLNGASYFDYLSAPSGVSATPTSGGTLTSRTYYYVVTALDSNDLSSAKSNEVSCTVSNPTTNACQISWSPVPGATKYRVWRGISSGGENRYFETTSTSYTDTGAAGTSRTPPLFPTSAYFAGSVDIAGKITSPKTFQAGKAIINGSGTWQTVTFPTPFDTTPVVVAVLSDREPGNYACFVEVRNITRTSFQFQCINWTGSIHQGTDPVNWIAIVP